MQETQEFISVHIVAATPDEAERIAHMLIAKRLAACVNILSPLRSLYRWRGKIEHAEEILLIAKTRRDLFDTLTAKVKALHSYECPCIVAVPLLKGYPPYMDWIATETGVKD